MNSWTRWYSAAATTSASRIAAPVRRALLDVPDDTVSFIRGAVLREQRGLAGPPSAAPATRGRSRRAFVRSGWPSSTTHRAARTSSAGVDDTPDPRSTGSPPRSRLQATIDALEVATEGLPESLPDSAMANGRPAIRSGHGAQEEGDVSHGARHGPLDAERQPRRGRRPHGHRPGAPASRPRCRRRQGCGATRPCRCRPAMGTMPREGDGGHRCCRRTSWWGRRG